MLQEALSYLYEKTGKRITIEYLLLKNWNDSVADAKKLHRFCRNFPVKINLIEYNATGTEYQKSPEANVRAFIDFLESKNMVVNVRRSRGQDIDAIIMACGGYGSSRIVNSLNWELIRSRNIPIVGYSDVSGLHLAALKHGCRNHVHGPMVSAGIGAKLESAERKAAYEKTMQSLCNVLNGEKNLLPSDAKLTVMKPGKATGPLVPTNLSLLHDLVGTPSMPDLSGAKRGRSRLPGRRLCAIGAGGKRELDLRPAPRGGASVPGEDPLPPDRAARGGHPLRGRYRPDRI